MSAILIGKSTENAKLVSPLSCLLTNEKMLVTLNYSGKLHSPWQTMLEKTNMAKNYKFDNRKDRDSKPNRGQKYGEHNLEKMITISKGFFLSFYQFVEWWCF